jgi:hypothetical protein
MAALYMLGNRRKASRFVAAALSSLRYSAQKAIGLQHGMQHIIAGILLCSFEVSSYILTRMIAGPLTTKKIHIFSQSSSVWLLYLSSTKAVINQLYQHGLREDRDLSLLFQWVFYNDTFAKLGTNHWCSDRSLQSQLAKEVGFDRGDSTLTNIEVIRSCLPSFMIVSD